MSLDCDRIILGRLAVFGHGRFAAVRRRFFPDQRGRKVRGGDSGDLDGFGLRAAGCAQRLRQPAGTGQEFFGFRRHLTLLQMVDELRRLVAPCFPHRAKDAGLGDAAEKVLDRWFPPGGDHVEIDALGKPIGMCHGARFAVVGFVYRID